MSRLLLALGVMLLAAPAGADTRAHADATGRLIALNVDGELVPVRTDIRVHEKGWTRTHSAGFWNIEDLKHEDRGDIRAWSGRLKLGDAGSYRVRQELHERDGVAELTVTVTADADLPIEGVHLSFGVDAERFAGGGFTLRKADGAAERGRLPPELPEKHHLAHGQAERVRFADARDNMTITLTFDGERAVSVQDARRWNMPFIEAYTDLTGSDFPRGRSVSATLMIAATGEADHRPATVTVDAARELYPFAGFGGNYCFGLRSPVTDHTLEHLPAAYTRLEAKLDQWEPRNDNDDPASTHWPVLRSLDAPGSDIRRSLEIARELDERGTPYGMSIWRLPSWMYQDPSRPGHEHGQRVDPAKWPEVLECIGSYLLHAREAYGVEPAWISFNECDSGVMVRLTPEEHRDAIVRVGRHLESLGLKTKLLLGDIVVTADSVEYAQPAANDAEARKYLAAVAVHSYALGPREAYEAWRDRANELGLPLLVTEFGHDSYWRAVQGHLYSEYFAWQELASHLRVLNWSRPLTTMQWELTDDYALLRRDASSARDLRPTLRYRFLEQLMSRTPRPANAVAATSDREDLLVAAFGAPDGGGVVHAFNLGASRRVTLAGIPDAANVSAAICRDAREPDVVRLTPRDGRVSLTLEAQTLVSVSWTAP